MTTIIALILALLPMSASSEVDIYPLGTSLFAITEVQTDIEVLATYMTAYADEMDIHTDIDTVDASGKTHLHCEVQIQAEDSLLVCPDGYTEHS